MLTVVPTPIGNLKDITLRALETLQSVDGIICEDTRRASLLLSHYQIKKPLLVLNDFNEAQNLPQIIEKLILGQNLALISDAGTPLICDPGYKLIRECLAKNITIDSLPGPSALITALTLSGLPTDKFLFLGYLPDKPGHRQMLYQQILNLSQIFKLTYIFYLSPYKIIKTLGEMLTVFGDIEITLAKELSKIHQSVESKKISQWLVQFKDRPAKGEWTMLLRIVT